MNYYNISLNQFFPVPGSISDNKRIILEHIDAEAARSADIICFPEASLTGYAATGNTAVRAGDVAVFAEDESVSEIRAAAEERNVIVSFGFLEKCGDMLYISHMVTGQGTTVCYRKTHLGSREKEVFEPGDRLAIWESDKLKIGVCLCWESHIPDIATYYRERGIQLLLVPYASGMGGERCRELWSRHLPARASDNGIYVAACNGLNAAACNGIDAGTCSGTIAHNAGKGCGIALYDPKGIEIVGFYEAKETSVMCRIGGDLPRERAEDMKHISYYDHRRPELYR